MNMFITEDIIEFKSVGYLIRVRATRLDRQQHASASLPIFSARHTVRHHAAQSATTSPGSRSNSRPFAVTRVAPRRRACAAIKQS